MVYSNVLKIFLKACLSVNSAFIYMPFSQMPNQWKILPNALDCRLATPKARFVSSSLKGVVSTLFFYFCTSTCSPSDTRFTQYSTCLSILRSTDIAFPHVSACSCNRQVDSGKDASSNLPDWEDKVINKA